MSPGLEADSAAANEPEALGPQGVNPSRPFIMRPVATTLFMLAVFLAGVVGYKFLPLSALPEVDYPTIQVTTSYPGASPDVMGLTVTAPLERQFGQMAGLSRMSSVSSAGASVITLQFRLDLTLDVAEQEVQAAINAANTLLPADLPAPPVYAKVNPADAPVLSLGITSATRTLADVQNLVSQRVANKISQISGVGLVSLSGGQRPAVRVQANVQALAAHGLSLDNLRTAIAAANVNGAKGSFDGPTRSWSIESNDQLADADEYKNLIIAYSGGAPVRLADVANVVDSSENTRLGAWMNRTPAIVVDVQRQPGANVIGTVDAIKAALPDLEAALPADLHVTLLTDRTTGIRASVHDVQMELVFAVILVTIAIFLFLGSFQATLIASLSVPLSIVGSFAAMHLLGFSLNNLTLMALTIASGFVVDDAIVVIENIARHLEEGKRPLEAALLGSREIGFTIISLTVSLIAVLIPLLFMGDVVGRLFREFAITLAVTILISAVVALTLVPMLSSRWLKSEHETKKPRFVDWTMGQFDRLSHGYSRLLDWVLLRQAATLLVFAGSLVLTALLFMLIPKGLFPEQDTGQLQAVIVTGQGVSFDRMSSLQGKVADAILQDPEVESLSSNVGVDGQNPALNSGRMLINLKDKEDRGKQTALIARLQQRVANVAGATLYVRPVQDLTIDAEGGPTQYRFALQGADQDQIDLWTQKLTDELKNVGQVRNIVSDMQANGRSVTVKINRDVAARLGISAASIDSALYNAFGQRIISTIFTQTTQYRVILESQPGMLTDPQSLSRLYVNTSSGTSVPLSTVATFVEGKAPLQVTRVAQFPASTIGFDLAPGQSLGHAVDAINAAEQRIGVPTAISTTFLGAANAFRASLSNEVWLILAAIVVVYIVLGVLYESFIHPVTILSTLPSAGVGALLALWITGNDLGVIGIIGIVLLIGIVKKNAIMMIDFAIEGQRMEGKDSDSAIRQAAHLRFRPIMMTTFAALFAALPLIFGSGMGSELRRPLGLAIAGGLIVSQALTLFTTPVIFLAFERLSARWNSRREAEPLLPLETHSERTRVNLSALFIRRPIGTLLLVVGVMMAGIAAFFVMPVAPLPQVDFPTISVSASLAGASPTTMATSVASPLEKRLATIAGVTELTSQSGIGSARITAQFDLSRDIDGAARDVQAAINAARADLPATLKTNPSYRKINPADAPIMIIALTSKTRSPREIYNSVSNIVQQRLLQVQGVGDVELGGAALPAVRIDLNPLALSRYGIPLEDVRTAIASTSANRPRGVVEGGATAWQIYGDTPGLSAADYSGIVVAWRNGIAVRLSDIASVYDGPEDIRTMGLFNGERAVTIIISRQPGANIIQTVDSVKAQLPAIEAAIPADIRVSVANDRTTTIRASLREVEITLVIATLLVVFVVSVFLRSLRATIVPATAVVASLLGTIGIMYLLGFSLNNLSLMALTVATGFVVDDAIVVLENISLHVERGMKPFEAALRGAREVGFTVLSISISLVAVFIPLLFMQGIVGRLFREFAITMTVAVMISLVISLTATPMIASRVLRDRSEVRPSRLADWLERQFERLQARYARSLDWALANRGATLLLLGGAVALNIFLLVTIQKGFFPEQDTGSLMGGLRADQSISFSDMQTKLTKIVTIIRKDPAVSTVVAFTGGSRAGGGFLMVTLKPKHQRSSARDVITRLRPKLQAITGVATFLMPVQDMRVGGRGGNSSYQYTLNADDPEVLAKAAPRLAMALKKYPEVTDVDVDVAEGGAQVYVDVDRDTATRLGITPTIVDNTLYDAFGQRQVATIYSGLNQYHVVMGVAPEFTGSPEALRNIYVPTGRAATASTTTTGTTTTTTTSTSTSSSTTAGTTIGATGTASGSTPVSTTGNRDVATGSAVNTSASTMTPLSSIAHWSTGSTAAQINHQSAAPAATISFNTGNGYSLSDAATRIREVQASLNLPAQVHGGFAGTAAVFQQSTSSTPILILSAIVVIYIVLGILYESTIHPLTVLSTLPSAGVGAVLALMLTGSEFDLIALIGLILLIGIVKKNAILIIDFALQGERNRGLSPMEAIREASLRRFRPILMTTMAAAFGAFPLAIGFGEGAELRRPLGIAIIGGLIASQFLTLLTTPVVYLALDRFRRRSPRERKLAEQARRRRDQGLQSA